MAKQSCLSSSEQVLVGIRYSIGEVGQLFAGVVHVRVAVHEGHLGGLRKMVWVYRKMWEVVHSSYIRNWWGVGGRLVGGQVWVDYPSLPQVFG